jgi:hypothetical protein
MKMKLWILKCLVYVNWEENRAVVVCATTARAARKLARNTAGSNNTVWLSPKTSSCRELKPTGKEELIITDNRGA